MQFLLNGTTREFSKALINSRYRVAMNSNKKEGGRFCTNIHAEQAQLLP